MMKTCYACGHQNADSAATCQACNTDLSGKFSSQPTEFRKPASSFFSKGKTIAGRYMVVRELGHGGMGIVFLAKDLELRRRKVALKMVHPHIMTNPEACKRFEDEVITCQQLTHDNIVRVHDLKRNGDQRFFTMEYLEGCSLRQLMEARQGRSPAFSVEEACTIVGQVLDGLAYAHRHTIHRDIKPENIMILGEPPNVSIKLLDFGIAKALSPSQFTKTNLSMGTAYYMAPEQQQGRPDIDHRADLYAVGMVLYELITGKVAAGRFKLPGELIAGVPSEIDHLIDKALNAEPNDRYAAAEEMRSVLPRLQSSSSQTAKGPSTSGGQDFCHSCGRRLKEDYFKCRQCGEFSCPDCRDSEKRGWCLECGETDGFQKHPPAPVTSSSQNDSRNDAFDSISRNPSDSHSAEQPLSDFIQQFMKETGLDLRDELEMVKKK
jgi:serine/threonine protein kinase